MSDNKFMPWEDWEFIGEIIEKSRWIFAKTMPQNPHYYMLRKESDDSEFVRFVELIRKYGYRYKYGRTWYIQLNVNDWYYWTMGCPLHNCPKTGTILINRKERRLGLTSPYDGMAEKNGAYSEITALKGEKMISLPHRANGPILEIGCGRGYGFQELMKEFEPEDYLGIDPSHKMLELFKGDEKTSPLHTDFESFNSMDKFNFIYATYGAASYVRPEFWERLNHMLSDDGAFSLMFYADSYIPPSHEFADIKIQRYSADNFPNIEGAKMRKTEVGNYAVVEGTRR